VASRTADLLEGTKRLEQQAATVTEQAALLDLAPDAIVVRDLQHRILFWNRGAEVMYGWTREHALGRISHELLRTQFSADLEGIAETLLREGRWTGEVFHHARNGQRLMLASRWALQPGTDGSPARILTIDTDITDRKPPEH
jgi:PAS domain S-box-containing protein